MLYMKPEVNASGTQPQIWFAIGVAYTEYAKRGYKCRITSLCDDTEGRVSNTKHSDGFAVDLGLRSLTDEEAHDLAISIKERLEPMGFDVVPHGKGDKFHLHIEYDPTEARKWRLPLS